MANIFQKLSGSLPSGLFKPKSTSALGIDIGNSAIKVVQIRREKGSAVLETYGEISLGPYAGIEAGRATNLPAEKLAEALVDVMREANVTIKECGVSIPFSASLISLIEMPQLDSAKLAKMIPIEARKYIPVPISEVQLDWFIIPKEEAQFFSREERGDESKDAEGEAGKKSNIPKTSVLLVAIHNEALRKYAEVVKLVKLQPSFFEIEIFSSIRAVMDRGTAPFVVVDIGAANTKIYIVEYGIVRVSHILNRGSQDMTLALARSIGVSIEKAEEMKKTIGLLGTGDTENEKSVSRTVQLTLEFIFSDIKRTILSYQQRYNKSIEKIIFTGAGAGIEGLMGYAAEHFDIDVEKAHPFSKIEAPAFLEEVLTEAGPEFSVAVGLALRKLKEDE